MKNLLAPVVLLCAILSGYSQVGINTNTPDPSSILDISSSNKGILLPRVALSGTGDNSTINNPAIGLFVYNTTNNGSITPGFYYWDGGKWENFQTGASSGGGGSYDENDLWFTDGNTVSSGQFIGSTNWQSFQVRVNNSQMALFHPNGGMAFGYSAVANNNNSVAIGTSANASASNQATALGSNSTASGFQSAALGYNSKAINSNSTLALGHSATASSFQATAIGFNSSASSSNNTLAIGTNSVATGENSSAIGTSANASGQYSMAIGKSSTASGQYSAAVGINANASAQNSMAVGYGAVANQVNTLILGNDQTSGWSATKVGIGTSNPQEKLEVHGNLKIASGKLKMESSSLQLADGTEGEGKYLTSDADGNTSWSDPSNLIKNAYADVYATSAQNLSNWSDTTINFNGNNGVLNVTNGSNYLQTTISGIYKVSYGVAMAKYGGSDVDVKCKLTVNGNTVSGSASYSTIGNGDLRTLSNSKIIHIDQYKQIRIVSEASSSNIYTIEDGTYLNIELIKAD